MADCDEKIVRVRDFTTLPGPREKKDGPNSAEEFFETCIDGYVFSDDRLSIDFDGTWGYPSSFISQLAGHLVELYESYDKVKRMVNVVSLEEPGMEQRLFKYALEYEEKHGKEKV